MIRQLSQVNTSKVFKTYTYEIYTVWYIVWNYFVRTHPEELIVWKKKKLDSQIFSNSNAWNVFMHYERNSSSLLACTECSQEKKDLNNDDEKSDASLHQ